MATPSVAATEHYETSPAFSALLFADAHTTQKVRGSDTDEETTIATDVVLSYSGSKLRALVEYALSDEENELERLQLGWQFNDDLVLWIGRYHNPDNFWNHSFHHGQYLQTSFSRPWMDRFEDEGGPLASHSTGLLLDYTHQIADGSAIVVNWGAGAGPHYESDLEPFDVFSPDKSHDLSSQARISYLPDVSQQNQIGFVASYSSIAVSTQTASEFQRVHQSTAGAYYDWSWAKFRSIGAFRYIHNELLPGRSDSFSGGYLYLQTDLTPHWQTYARVDFAFGSDDSRYLALQDESVDEQYTAGLRWDFARRHAITLEFSRKIFTTGDNRSNLTLQWSAAFP